MGLTNDFFLKVLLVSAPAKSKAPAIVVKEDTESMAIVVAFLKALFTEISTVLIY